MKSEAKWEVIYGVTRNKVYEGFTVAGKPYGAGVVFFPSGKIYQEGIFDIKGLVYGREYYPSGQVRFEGAYEINNGYGPNYPVYGKCYDESGEQYFSGKLHIRRSGLGWPKVIEPELYGAVVQDKKMAEISYFMWEDES